MALYELLLPKMGESVAEATIIKWVKQPGDTIDMDDSVLEIATDKVDSEVPSPVAGKLVQTFFKEDDVVQVGAVIATIETEGGNGQDVSAASKEATNQTSEPGAEVPFVTAPVGSAAVVSTPAVSGADQSQSGGSAGTSENSGRFYSPLVKSVAAEEGISLAELDTISGSGLEGRVTKQDIFDYIKKRKGGAAQAQNIQAPAAQTSQGNQSVQTTQSAQTPQSTQTSQSVPATQAAQASPAQQSVKASQPSPAVSVSGGDEIIEMDRMRKLIAEHMVMSKHTSPHVTSFVEADVTNMVKWRDKVKSGFEKREGQKITFTPIFIEAVAKAIKDLPMINVSVNGTQIIKRKDINIGMAAALPSGNLIVPVIKNADQLNLLGLTKSVNDLASRARLSKLKPDETNGGTFTLTNVGSFGNVMGTPIINQPQAAILAVGAIKKKPAVIETEYGDVIAIRHMMFLSLSYDHRVVDGALGGSFVRKVADYLEAWDVNREI